MQQSASLANLHSASPWHLSGTSPHLLVITPQRLLCSVSGKVVVDSFDQNQCQNLLERENNEVQLEAAYRHPLLKNHPGTSITSTPTDFVERDLEAFGVYSLARTIQFGLSYNTQQPSPKSNNHSNFMSDQKGSLELRELLQGMQRPNPSQSISLLELLQRVSDHWQTIVGSSPISRFISQLYRLTATQSHAKSNTFMPYSSSCSAIALTNHDERTNAILNQCLIDPVATAAAPPMIEVEFSRLDTSSSSSCESSPSSPVPPTSSQSSELQNHPLASPLTTSLPNLNNNHKEGKIEAQMSGEQGGSRQNIHRPSIHHLGQDNSEERRWTRERRLGASTTYLHNSTSRPYQPSHRGGNPSSSSRSSLVSRTTSNGALDYENINMEANLNREKSHSTTHDTLVLNLPVTPSAQPKRGRGPATLITTTSKRAAAGATTTTASSTIHKHHHQPNQPLNGDPGELAGLSNKSCNATTTPLNRRRVQRNPSRLYRVVRPLAEITPTPSPATKRCIGPEFVVMSDNDPIVIDLASHSSSRKDSLTKQVSVVLLNGQRVTVYCSPLLMTIGELLDQILSYQDMKETCYYGLALQVDREFWILASDTKLSKVAPSTWKDSRFTGCSPFTLHLRFKYLPDSMDSFKDPNNMHQFYLQLRSDVIDGLYQMSQAQHIGLAGMALQTEFGDFSEDIHGDGYYFILDHYLPRHVIRQLGEDEARQSVSRLHRAHLGQSQSKTELKYCKEIQRLDNFGFHTFSVQETKKTSSTLNLSSSSASSTSHHQLHPHQSCGKIGARHIGVHLQGMFLFETSKDPAVSHKIIGSFSWHQISRIQYDKSRFQLSVQDSEDKEKTFKLKFYVAELKAKVMFDLSSAHHQFYIQQRWNSAKNLANGGGAGGGMGSGVGMEDSSQRKRGNNNGSDQVEYREPKEKTIRSLKNRLLPKRQISQRKIYTKNSSLRSSTPSVSSGHSSTSVSSRTNSRRSSTGSATTGAKLMVKRLTHYTSMANTKDHKKDSFVAETAGCSPNKMEEDSQLNTSNKENQTPNSRHQSYRYKVYLEPEEDDNPQGAHNQVDSSRQPLQEKPISQLQSQPTSPSPPPLPRRTRASTIMAARRRIPSIATSTNANNQHRRRSETQVRTPATTKTPIMTGSRRQTRKSMGGAGGVPNSANSNSVRMGTRISASALHRERLRLASEMGTPLPPAPKKRSLDLDYDTMEVKSLLLPPKPPSLSSIGSIASSMGIQTVIENRALPYDMNHEESLTDSLIERFDNMESEDSEPERQIVMVTLTKDPQGKLGLKITGTPSGIYIDRIDVDVAKIQGHLKIGDRIVAINGRSLENVPYSGALQLIKNSMDDIQFLVSQIKG
ncbi:hypothetical protein TCAL_12859 [Tigriopus californicus]|uniref:FERM domain-containing protein n=2 Tax=Tigriopus californicus TaxID=6832 RepID=A0A553P5Q3_TIGCA|nr:hypothetical protein TCAL_12859 [Tigriopus californicus]